MRRSGERRVRLAWFSPVPPARSGVATNSAELVAALSARYTIDVFVDEPVAHAANATLSAHEFVWRHRRRPYDLAVYQLGNSAHHNYLWPYLFRYPGLVVLHDARLHHARAAALLTERRPADYAAEFAANHPVASPDLAQLGIRGFDTHLYYMWPMRRLVVESSRVTAVHSRALAAELREECSADASIEPVALTQGVLVDGDRTARARREVRRRYGIPEDAMLFAVAGGLTPEKRLSQILDAFAALPASLPTAPLHLLLAGGAGSQYDVAAAVRDRRLDSRVTITGYLASDDELTDCLAACDVSLNLRWPTAREVSGPWLRALAAGRPTITTDLAHVWDVPSFDPRTWTLSGGGRHRNDAEPVTVAVDLLDENHSLRLAMRRLASDPVLRASLGAAARAYWHREHSLERSVADYERVIECAMNRQPPRAALPPHLVNSGDHRLRELLAPFGVLVDF